MTADREAAMSADNRSLPQLRRASARTSQAPDAPRARSLRGRWEVSPGRAGSRTSSRGGSPIRVKPRSLGEAVTEPGSYRYCCTAETAVQM